jgi:type III secretory pathway component EscS
MLIESFDVVFYTGIFVLPGFIINGIIAAFNPTKKLSEGVLLLKSLLYSIIHCAIWSWLYKIIFEISDKYPKTYWFVLVLITIIVASFLGTIIGLIQQKQLIRKVLSYFKIYILHSIPNAWDYCFSENQSVWLIVTLVDGSMIYGQFSNKSFASSDIEERDLYVEKMYSIDDDNNWIEIEGINGIYIPKEQIKTIEFLKGK